MKKLLLLLGLLISLSGYCQSSSDYLRRADSLVTAGRDSDAITYYSRAIELDTTNIRALLGRAKVKTKLGDYYGWLDDYMTGWRLTPADAATYIFRGDASGEGMASLAIDDYTKAIELGGGTAEVYTKRGYLYWIPMRNNVTAMEDFSTAIRLNPSYGLAYYRRGEMEYELNEYQEALADFSQAIRLDTGYCQLAYYYRGRVRGDMGDHRAAIADYTRSIALDTARYNEAYYYRGVAETELGDYQAAIADYSIMLSFDSTYYPALVNRAMAKINLQDHPGALADLDQTVTRFGENSTEVYFYRGMEEIAVGRRDDGCREFKDLVQQDYKPAIEMVAKYCK